MDVDSAFQIIDEVLRDAVSKLNNDAKLLGYTGFKTGSHGAFTKPSSVEGSGFQRVLHLPQTKKVDASKVETVSGIRIHYFDTLDSIVVFELIGAVLKQPPIASIPLADVTEKGIRETIDPYVQNSD